MTESNSCPSSFVLLGFATCPDEAEERVAEHIAGCADCQRLVDEQRAQGAAYESSPSADALGRRLQGLDDGAAPRTVRTGAPPTWAWGGVLAAAASFALVFSMAGSEGIKKEGQPASYPNDLPTTGPMDTLTSKGGVQLALWVEHEAEAGVQLGESAVLRPGQRVQATFSAENSGFVALLLTTPAGVVVPLYPTGRAQSAPLEAGPPAPLGPSFRLDEEVGTYRVTVYFSESRFSTKELLAEQGKDEGASLVGVVSTREFEVQP